MGGRLGWALGAVLSTVGCSPWDGRREPDPYDVDFDIPRTETFANALSDYDLYEEPLAALRPARGVLPYELSSELFTDYAHKQRLLWIPEGSSITVPEGETAEFPEGTVLAKTFYYPLDLRDSGASSRIIETRLLVRTAGVWNVATYLWNAEQTDATLLLMGTTTTVSWLDEAGQSRSTDYVVPHEGECVTCHQLDGASAHIGPTLQNLNRRVMREGTEVNQLVYLQTEGVLENVDEASIPTLVDYRDVERPLGDRARAYLDINCAHCHGPGAWDEAAEQDVDLRHATPLRRTGLDHKAEELEELLEDGEMPYLGTTLLHTEGIRLVLDYLDSL